MGLKQIFTWLPAVILLTFVACKTSFKDTLVCKWKATDLSGENVTSETKKRLASNQPAIEFFKDGTYTSWAKGKENEKGNYRLSENGKALTIKALKHHQERQVIVKELTKDKFVIDLQPYGSTTITFEPSK